MLQELDISANPLEGALSPTFSQLERLAVSPAALVRSQQCMLSDRAALRELYLINLGVDSGARWHHSLLPILRCLPALSRLAFNPAVTRELGPYGVVALVALGRQRPGLQVEVAHWAPFGGVPPSEDFVD